MPGRDRTGPAGMGPMTGRGWGDCADYGAPNAAFRRGYGPGYGRGGWGGRGGGRRGWRHGFYATGLPGWARYGYGPFWEGAPLPTQEQELDMLKREAEWLENQLNAISQRIKELE